MLVMKRYVGHFRIECWRVSSRIEFLNIVLFDCLVMAHLEHAFFFFRVETELLHIVLDQAQDYGRFVDKKGFRNIISMQIASLNLFEAPAFRRIFPVTLT